jgi:hypothetical protein
MQNGIELGYKKIGDNGQYQGAGIDDDLFLHVLAEFNMHKGSLSKIFKISCQIFSMA